MIGGRVIEVLPMVLTDEEDPSFRKDVVRLWCANAQYTDECAVFAEPADVMPKVGDEIWWQDNVILFDGDRRRLVKVGYSFDPEDEGLMHREDAGLLKAEEIADHWHQWFLRMKDETDGNLAVVKRFSAKAEGAKQVLDEIRAERARLEEMVTVGEGR